ncbi:hypothetical protein QRX50_19630 [Amycolatopsis carbonis]|uniref:Uncharacterized protein n=1 Tax=Amycolatopsis carbonis TaxID=715471 RepID=A0A9Y2IQT9_9PSEU|nr:hypothetical protein [Amycolatopsis sp. 2-15]WIX82828.1 hypothetical protein QRX50_19630 [Amycolatopsis sp. 2-15]
MLSLERKASIEVVVRDRAALIAVRVLGRVLVGTLVVAVVVGSPPVLTVAGCLAAGAAGGRAARRCVESEGSW